MPPPDLPPIVDALQAGLENIVEIAADLSLGPKTQAYDPEAAARAAAHPISTDLSVPDIVVQGTKMTKVSTQQKKVLFRIDPDEGKILYESRKGGCSTRISRPFYFFYNLIMVSTLPPPPAVPSPHPPTIWETKRNLFARAPPQ